MDTDEAPAQDAVAEQHAVTVDSVFAALNAALGVEPSAREAAQAKLQAYEKDAVPGFLVSLLTIVQQGQALNEARLRAEFTCDESLGELLPAVC